MTTVQELFKAAQQLSPQQLLQLRKRLDKLEAKSWAEEQEKTAAAMKRQGISDKDIDRLVLRRRRESRR